jgi:hypothetical protein
MIINFKSDPRSGDIAFSHPVKMGFYSKAVRWFTRSRWSHCFFMPHDYLSRVVVMEADLCVQIVPFKKEYIEKENDAYEIYRPILASKVDIINASMKCLDEDAGQAYGFLEIPWHAFKAILKWFGFKLKNNPTNTGVICNELLYSYIYNLGGEYRKSIEHLISSDTNPQELYEIVLLRKDLFEYIGSRVDG